MPTQGSSRQSYSIRLMPVPYGSIWDRVAEYTKQQLEQLGFKVTIEATDPGGWSKKLSDWDFDLTMNFLVPVRRSGHRRGAQLRHEQHHQGHAVCEQPRLQRS